MFWEEKFRRIKALYGDVAYKYIHHSWNTHTKRCRAFSEWVAPRILPFESVDNFETSEYIRRIVYRR